LKPLFDSEQFSFIGSDDNQIYVHCRKCGQQARILLEVSKANGPELRATCPGCHNHRTFTFMTALGTSAGAPN